MADTNPIDVLNQQSSASIKKANTKPGGNMGKDAFMKLLVTQMKYQDPLNPMDNTAYLSQLAQFTSLEQMQNLNDNFEGFSAQSLIGKYGYAYYTDEKSGETSKIEGVISRIAHQDGKSYAVLDDKQVLASDIKIVEDAVAPQEVAKVQQMQAGNAFSLIDKYVYGKKYDENNKKYSEVEGIVTEVRLGGGKFYLKIGDQEVELGRITKVVNQKPGTEKSSN